MSSTPNLVLPSLTPELAAELDLMAEALVKDPRNHQMKDLHKIASPIASRWLQARGYPEQHIVSLF